MKCDVFKRTSDNWYGSYTLGDGCNSIDPPELLVAVSFLSMDDGEWGVFADGTDDYAIGRVFDDEKAAWCCFLEVIGLEDVTRAELERLGFGSC